MQLGERDIGSNGSPFKKQSVEALSQRRIRKKRRKLVYFLRSLRKNDAVRDGGPGGFN